MSPRVKESSSVGFWTPRRGLRIPGTGVQIFFSGTWIPDSHCCIPESKAQDSEFHRQKFPVFPYLGRKIDPWPGSNDLFKDHVTKKRKGAGDETVQ